MAPPAPDHPVAQPPALDGGRGWVIVVCGFLALLLGYGSPQAVGILYPEWLLAYGEGKAMTAWVGSLVAGAGSLMGPISGVCLVSFGVRPVTIFSGVMVAGGLMLSAFAPNVPFLIFSYGIVVGVGVGLLYAATVTITCLYFDQKRGVALGIVSLAIENPKYQGATMYHYKEGSLVTTDFTLPRFSPVEDLIDRSDMLWYACDLTFNPNTANKDLALSDNNTFVESGKKQNHPDHPERFDSREQVLCKEGLNGRHYWEVEWTGSVTAGAAYIGMERKGFSSLGRVPNSWGMTYVPGFKYYSMIGHKKTDIYLPYESRSFKRLGMFLDWQAGTLSFYMVSSNVLHHMHTYRHAFTEPVYPGFRLGSDVDDGQVRLL